MRCGLAVSLIAQTGQSEAIHSPDECATTVVRVIVPAAWSTAVVCRVAISRRMASLPLTVVIRHVSASTSRHERQYRDGRGEPSDLRAAETQRDRGVVGPDPVLQRDRGRARSLCVLNSRISARCTRPPTARPGCSSIRPAALEVFRQFSVYGMPITAFWSPPRIRTPRIAGLTEHLRQRHCDIFRF
jgi:hypothetical protein